MLLRFLQSTLLLSTILISLLTALLALIVTKRYFANKFIVLAFWTALYGNIRNITIDCLYAIPNFILGITLTIQQYAFHPSELI